MLAASGVADPEAWLAEAEQAVLADLREHGPEHRPRAWASGCPRSGSRCSWRPASRTPPQGAHTRVLTILGFAGRDAADPASSWINGAYAYAAADDWLPGGLGSWTARGGRRAGRPLAARFGPATTADLQLVDGLDQSLTTGRRSPTAARWRSSSPTGPGWLAADDEAGPAPSRGWRCCPGWTRPRWAGSSGTGTCRAAAAEAFDSVGNGGPTLWVDGRIVGAWAQTRDGEIHTHYFEPVPPTAAPGDRRADRRGHGDGRRAPGSPSGSPATSMPGILG